MPSIANAGFDSTICASSTVLTGNIPTIGTGFWTSSNGSIIADPASYLTSVSSLSTGTNTFTWTISNGTCPSSSDIVTVMVDANPSIADAGPDITTHLLTADLSASIPMVGSGNWTLVSGSADFLNNSDPQTPVEHLKHGENVLRWTISNGTCPSVSDDVVVTVHPIILPSGFSPNGDNVNDYFEVPDIEELGTVALEVYNRWGNLVYSDGEYKNNWDGKSNDGSDLSDDTYYYMLQVGDTRSFKGYIVIKRK
jgi:gliding motility-associated-like protein